MIQEAMPTALTGGNVIDLLLEDRASPKAQDTEIMTWNAMYS